MNMLAQQFYSNYKRHNEETVAQVEYMKKCFRICDYLKVNIDKTKVSVIREKKPDNICSTECLLTDEVYLSLIHI